VPLFLPPAVTRAVEGEAEGELEGGAVIKVGGAAKEEGTVLDLEVVEGDMYGEGGLEAGEDLPYSAGEEDEGKSGEAILL